MLNFKRRRERDKEIPPYELLQENQHKKFEYLGFRLLDLPSSIIIEVLTKTPTEEILNCRCVCKTLCSLISDPYFVKDFISRAPFSSIVLGSKNKYHFVKLGSSENYASGGKKSKRVNSSFISHYSNSIDMIGCCNGLICLWDKYSEKKYKIYVTNPVLGKFVVLPNPCNDKYAALRETYGFCFCQNSGEYKVVKIKTRRAFRQPNQKGYYRKTEVWILVVGSGTWRYVGDAPFPFLDRFCHVILNGRIHWIVDHECKGPINLHSLDITEEQAYSVPAPPELSCENLSIELGVLGESLCLFDSFRSDTHLEIWTMREYGVATSWTKDCIVTTSIRARSLRPIAAQENGMILMLHHWGPVFCYDPKEGEFTNVYDFRGDGMDQAELYTPSFLSLEHISSGARLKVKKVKSYTWDFEWFS